MCEKHAFCGLRPTFIFAQKTWNMAFVELNRTDNGRLNTHLTVQFQMHIYTVLCAGFGAGGRGVGFLLQLTANVHWVELRINTLLSCSIGSCHTLWNCSDSDLAFQSLSEQFAFHDAQKRSRDCGSCFQ